LAQKHSNSMLKPALRILCSLVYIRGYRQKIATDPNSKTKKTKKRWLRLPFLHDVLGNLRRITWPNLNLPATELFDFPAYS